MAVLADSNPMTRPRLCVNQRVATVAPSTMAVRPVPMPMTTPHSRTSCHNRVMPMDSNSPTTMIASETSIIRRTPKRFMKAAANGPIPPKRRKRMASAPEMSAVLQPNSLCRGMMNTPGAPTAPATTSMVRKVAASTAQP